MAIEVEMLADCWPEPDPEDLAARPRTIVGISGGVDSTVLAHAMVAWCRRKGRPPPSLAHVAYRLRGEESEREIAFVEGLARELSLGLTIYWTAPPPRSGLQAWAREVRRECFRQLAQGGAIIALGHHRDDLAENVLLRLSRGAQPGSVAGMRPVQMPIWRPLLHLSRAEIEAFSATHGLAFCHDSSNDSLKYRRNAVRHQLVPLLERIRPGAAARLASFGEAADDLDRALRALNPWLTTPRVGSGTDRSVDLTLLPTDPHLARYFVRQWLGEQLGSASHIRGKHVEALMQAIDTGRDLTLEIDPPWQIVVSSRRLQVITRPPTNASQTYRQVLWSDEGSIVLPEGGAWSGETCYGPTTLAEPGATQMVVVLPQESVETANGRMTLKAAGRNIVGGHNEGTVLRRDGVVVGLITADGVHRL